MSPEFTELDEYHAHEALDRASMMCNVVESELFNHPFVQAHPEIAEKVRSAITCLADAYQAIGALHLNGDARPAQVEPPQEHSLRTALQGKYGLPPIIS